MVARECFPRRNSTASPASCGQGRLSSAEFKQFLGQARGSPLEVETQVLIAQELGYLGNNETQGLLNFAAEAGRILNGLLASLPSRR
jgi:four helix bundle protein